MLWGSWRGSGGTPRARILSRARKPHPAIPLISMETPNHSCFGALPLHLFFPCPQLAPGDFHAPPPSRAVTCVLGGARPRWDPVGSGQPQPCPGKVLLFQTRPNHLPKHPSSNSGWKPPRGWLCSSRVLSHLGVPVLWDNARSRGVFFWGVAGRRAPCMHWGQVEAPHSRAARPPQPAVLQVGAEGCGCCSARPCSPRSAAACKSAAEMQPGGFASYWCPLLSSCLLGSTCTGHLRTANCCTLHPAFISCTLQP